MDLETMIFKKCSCRVRLIWTKIPILLILLAYLTSIGASPARERSICGPAKCTEGNKFHYKAGNIYAYHYVINGTTSIESGRTEQSGLHLSSQVAIKFFSACDAVLYMRDVAVWQSYSPGPGGNGGQSDEHHFKSQDSQLSRALEEFPIRFSYADGMIEEICPDPGESTLALNVKRGLLSTFQNTMRRLDLEHKGEEDDVHGKCKVDYKLGLATSSSLTITRIKDISSCGDKFGILSSVQGTPYSFGTLHQSMPAVSSTSDCQHVVDRNLLTEIRCLERHRLQSLSRGTAGALTNVLQNLKIFAIHDPENVTGIGIGGDESLSYILPTLPPSLALVISEEAGIVYRRESLLFKHDYHLGQTLSDFAAAKTALATFCSSVKEEVRGESGELFESLVNVLRGLPYSDMGKLSQEATNICHGDRTLFDDALEAVGTAASVGVITDRINRGDASKGTVESWIASLTFIPKPDLSLMNAVVYLIKSRITYPQIILTLSSLSHAYCRHTPKCTQDRPIRLLTQMYEKMSAQGCSTKTPSDVLRVLTYLKGIGNFGILSPGINNILQKCAEKSDVMEIRVAAIDAYRRMDCTTDVTLFKTLFENWEEDSEVRIAAFLALMRCPTYATVIWIKDMLDKEEVNQVGSFVWTYLKNMQETALPSKAELQGLVADEKLSKKFASNAQKFSRNLEVSTFYDDFNLGIGLDSNLIFSQNSYLPRSAALNLTVDLFGESINVFEATLRMENFEHYIESLFGPQGKFANKNLEGIVASLRSKRALPSKSRLNKLREKEYDAHRRYYSDPIASLSLRTFGNEVFFDRKVGAAQHKNLLKALDPTYYLKRLAEKDTNWQKSAMLLDSSYIIPTGSGLPLNLSAQASALLRMKATGMMIDVENFRANSPVPEFKLRGEVQPSAILTVMGSMVLGTPDLQTGIKVKAHLRSSTSMEANVHMKGMELLQAEFGLPKTKLELLEYRSDVMFMQGNAFHVAGQVSGLSPVCTGDLVGSTLGLKLCRSSFFSLSPNSQKDDLLSPYFPLNGPAHFTLSVDKADSDLTSTRLHYEWNQEEKRTKLFATYEIKGSKNTQVLDLAFDLNRLNQDFLFGVKLPSNEFEVSGELSKDLSNGRMNISLVAGTAVILKTHISYDTTQNANRRRVLEPKMLITLNANKILDAKGKVKIEEGNGLISYEGNLGFDLGQRKEVNVELRGSRNDTSLTLVLDTDYKISEAARNPETIRWKSTISKFKHEEESTQIDTTLNLDFSEFPDYNLGASWKYQCNENGFDYAGEARIGPGPSWTDRDQMKIRHSASVHRTYDGSDYEWLLRISQPSRSREWGLDGKLNSRGKSLDSAINLRYAPDKNLQTSLSLKRAPGVLTFLQIGWNITASNQHPLQLELQVEETAQRVYQGKLGADWFGTHRINVDVDYVDRTRRQRVDKDLKMSIQASTFKLLKLSSHVYKDDKEAKLILGSDYGGSKNSLELGHVGYNKGKGPHNVYTKLNIGPTLYLVTSDLETDKGFSWILRTDLSSKFPDILLRMGMKEDSGITFFELDYKWDATQDPSKKFSIVYFMDLSTSHHQRLQLVFSHPDRHFDLLAGHKIEDDESRGVMGSLSWDGREHLHLNARLRPTSLNRRISNPTHLGYELTLGASTPFQDVRNVSLVLRLNCEKKGDCLIDVDGNWGELGRDKVSGTISSNLQFLDPEEDDKEGEDEDENESEESKEMTSQSSPSPSAHTSFSWRLKANLTTSFPEYRVINASMTHTQWTPLRHKTDLDIQLPGGQEINMASQWRIPRTYKEIWYTRAELHFKSTIPDSPNFQLRVLAGQQDDSDTLVWAGVYADSFQYGFKITGTPRLEEDGALGFELTTSHPNLDKIFGSLNYAIGDESRLACQLGWPGAVIGLEAGFEWSGSWEEFQVFYTFTSPWEPLKNINALAKIDSAQVELKAELNDVGVAAKCEWVIESWETFDIRFEGTTPLVEVKKVTMIIKNSFEDELVYHSQVSFSVNENQVGYKLEGGRSEEERENAMPAVIYNSQIEIDTIVYPTIRSTFNLVVKESIFNLGLSLLLREGPINVSVELNLLDLLRFNEKITITTPYAGLFELEINLTPAIKLESDLYNFGVHTRWRSRSEWKEGGLFIRYGDQSVLAEALESDRAAAAVDEESDDDDDEDEDDEEERKRRRRRETPKTQRLNVPESQLFHFYSPLTWAKVVKLEYEIIPSAENKPKSEPTAQFPIRNFALIFSSDNAQLSASLRNELSVKSVSGRIDIREIEQPVSLRFDATIDLTQMEKKMNVNAASDHPTRQEMYLVTTWQSREDFVTGNIELRTPFDNLEVQTMSGMYARNAGTHTLNWELSSDALGKTDTTLTIGPAHFSMTLNMPIDELKDLDLRADTSPMDGSPDTFTTLISLKRANQELVQIDLETTVKNEWPTEIKGTIITEWQNLKSGNLKAAITSSGDGNVGADGTVEWEQEKLTLALLLKLPQRKFQELDVKVTTTFKDYENWKLWLHRQPATDDDDEDDEEDELFLYGDEEWNPKIRLDFKAETPFNGFRSIEGQSSFQMGSSFFQVKKVTLSGNASNGSLDIMTSWIISEWNRFDVHCDSKYSIHLDASPSSSSFLSSIHPTNSAKFKLRNLIPTLDTLFLLDSAFHLEMLNPPARVGGTSFVELVHGESLRVKLGAKLPTTAHEVDLKSDFDKEYKSINSHLIYTDGPPNESYTSTLNITRETNSLKGEAEIEWGRGDFAQLQSKFNSSFTEDDLEFHAQVFSHSGSKLIGVADGTFDKSSGRHRARVEAESGQESGPLILELDVDYFGIQDMTSSLNVTSPFTTIPSAGVRVVSKILRNTYTGFCEGRWAEDKASVNYSLEYDQSPDSFQLEGSVGTQLPFPDLQSTFVKAMLKRNPTSTEGSFKTDLNDVPYVAADVRHETSSSAGREKDFIQLDVYNPFWPLGLTRTYSYDYSGGYDGLNLPTTTVRLLELYDLGEHSRDLHKLGGELKIHTNFNGREITLTGRHPSRTLKLQSTYAFLDHRFQQNTTFSWNPSSFIGYDLDVRNLTTRDKREHRVGLRVSYPVRVIALNTGFQTLGSSGFRLSTDVNFNQSQSERKLSGIFNWEADKTNPSHFVRRASLVIKHPALTQDIRAAGELKIIGWESGDGKLSLDYAQDPNKRLTLMIKTLQEMNPGGPYYWNLTSNMRLEHSATNLDLTALSTNRHSPHELSIITLIDFKNSGKEGKKSKIAFELFKELRKLHIMLNNPDEQFELSGDMSGEYPLYIFKAEENITGVFPLPKAQLSIDFRQPYVRMYAVQGSDLTDGIYAEGGVIDSRNVKFDISESYDNYRFTDINFFFRINHSRLVTSRLRWRPELLQELQGFALNRAQVVRRTWTHQTNKFIATVSSDGSEAFWKIWEDAQGSIGPFLEEMSDTCDFKRDADAVRQFVQDSHANNDFYFQDISSLAQVFAEEVSLRFSNIFIKIREYRRDLLGDASTSEMFEQTLLWVLEKMKTNYRQLLAMWKKYKVEFEWPEGPSATFPQFQEKISAFVDYGFELFGQLVDSILDALAELGHSVNMAIIEQLKIYKPSIMNYTHRVEIFFYNLILKFSDFIYETREDVLKSEYFTKLAHLADDVDELYKDLSKNNATTNFKKYLHLAKNFIAKKFGDVDEYQKQLGELGNYISGLWTKFKNLKQVQSFQNSMDECKANMKWLMDYFRLDKLVQDTAIIVYTRGADLLYSSVLEAGSRYQHAKTKFMFNADKGIMYWKQKLPMPWSEFSESPVFTELPEYKNVIKIQEFFDSTRGSILDAYYKSNQDNKLISWLPPPDGHAMIVGHEHFFTFDGRFYNFTGPCVYLLAGDLVDGNFSVSIQYKEKRDGSLGHQILVQASNNVLIVDLEAKTLRDAKKPQNTALPIQTMNLEGYRDRANLVVEAKNKGLTLSCNMVYWFCQLRVSGWYSRKVAGLLGAMDQEPTTDLIFSSGKVAKNLNDMATSWLVSDNGTEPCLNYQSQRRISRRDPNSKIISTCTKLFHSRLSTLQPCFTTENVGPFKQICMSETGNSTRAVCTAAAAYVAMCQTKGISIELPALCIKCDLNGEEMIDHDTRVMDSKTQTQRPLSTDIVLLVEAKACNSKIGTKKNMDTLISVLEGELKKEGFENNRYAIVIFGGSGVSSQPHVVTQNNTVFASADDIGQYLTHIPTGNGSLDIFGALAYSLKLRFRPQVTKTFILLPCSTCQPQHMTMDFSTIHYALLEQDATLHILMNNDFPSDNKKVAKNFFGMDTEFAYTKSNGENENLKGNVNLRKEIKISKKTLGYCTPLALQTNGTIFNGKKLQNKRSNIVELFSKVFSWRIIKTAKIQKCQQCVCSPGEDGLGQVECFLCDYPRYTSLPELDDDSELEEEDILLMNEMNTFKEDRTTQRPTTTTTTTPSSIFTNFEKPTQINKQEKEDEDDDEDNEDEDDDDDEDEDDEEYE